MSFLLTSLVTLLLCQACFTANGLRRSIDLSATHSLVSESKLPLDVTPLNYTLDLKPNVVENTFSGKVKILLKFQEPTNQVTLHAGHELEFEDSDVKLWKIHSNGSEIEKTEIKIRRVDRMPRKPQLVVYLKEYEKQGIEAELEIDFRGQIFDNSNGLFKGYYIEKQERKYYLATHFRPNNAKRLFPCFDEPSIKVPFAVTISRPKNFTTLFNTPVVSSVGVENDYVSDTFAVTPSMSTFTFGFVMSELEMLSKTQLTDVHLKNVCVKIYGRSEMLDELDRARAYERVEKVLTFMQNYLGVDYPLEKLDIIALPSLNTIKPIDAWGVISFRESELTSPGYYGIANELANQWIGSWITPLWFNDFHINKALCGFLAVATSISIDGGSEFEGKWPMNILYSLYYEFSKRFPHSKITGMKQETISSKTELVLRMLNLTLGAETFKNGVKCLISEEKLYKTFTADDFWNCLTKQAHADQKLDSSVSVNEIVSTWVTKDRIPVVSAIRNYQDGSINFTQKMYLRERPHDVPEQDKMLWWIPLVVISGDYLDFAKTKPLTWIDNKRSVVLKKNLPTSDNFVIVNPEEIAPFPVNYDAANWKMLSDFLQTEKGMNTIPPYTRAKLLHDAWNLAFAGSLNFSSAFDMTLFLKLEKNHIVWNPVFTMIDHIGRHIDSSGDTYNKFEVFVKSILTPLYQQQLGREVEYEENWKRNLRSLSKSFLCRVGYEQCIKEAQHEFSKWTNMSNPEDGNPVANQYICPVYKWGTMEEWEFGLMRVINFPASRKQSERTFLLKNLAGCPNTPPKVLKLLNSAIIEENSSLSENDILLIMSMLSGNSNGYTTLLQFVEDNWDLLKKKFSEKSNIWDSMISSSTGSFTTSEGLKLVRNLHDKRKGDFGSAEHIIDRNLKNIKEETKWSEENLPEIRKWLENYLKSIE